MDNKVRKIISISIIFIVIYINLNFWVQSSEKPSENDLVQLVLLLQSRYQEALKELDTAWELSKGSNPDILSLRGIIHAKSGSITEAEKVLGELFDLSKRRYVSPHLFASLYMALSQKDKAFEWLDKAYSKRSEERTELKIDPLWDDLRPGPRFSELLKKIGLE